MNLQKSKIFWKGKLFAELDETEIAQAIKFGKIGLFHEIETEGGARISMKKFLDSRGGQKRFLLESKPAKDQRGNGNKRDAAKTPKTPREEKAAESSNAESVAAYTISGLCFISPYVLVATAFFDAYLLRRGLAKLALATTAIAVVLSVLGVLFFNAVLKL